MKTVPSMKNFDFSSIKTLTACNFVAPWGTWTNSTFLEASNLTLHIALKFYIKVPIFHFLTKKAIYCTAMTIMYFELYFT